MHRFDLVDKTLQGPELHVGVFARLQFFYFIDVGYGWSAPVVAHSVKERKGIYGGKVFGITVFDPSKVSFKIFTVLMIIGTGYLYA